MTNGSHSAHRGGITPVAGENIVRKTCQWV
jgi:hypothetical protein